MEGKAEWQLDAYGMAGVLSMTRTTMLAPLMKQWIMICDKYYVSMDFDRRLSRVYVRRYK